MSVMPYSLEHVSLGGPHISFLGLIWERRKFALSNGLITVG